MKRAARSHACVAVGLCAALASWLTAVPAARALPITCPKSPYHVDLAVVYANGMFTSHASAIANLQRMRPLVDTRLGQQPYAIEYGLAYNISESVLDQLRNVIRERVAMTGSAWLRLLNGALPLPDWLSEELDHLATEFDQAGFLDDTQLERHVQMYRDHLRSGHKVVVIAHSEGNLYANTAYRRLFESALPTEGERSFGIVGVALPAATLAGWQPPSCPLLGCYTTFEEDVVVGTVRKALPDTAPGNVSGAARNVGRADLGWHGLTESYLKVKAARTQILDHVAAFVSAFEPLEATFNDSTVTAMLDWNTDADLDLHVYEDFGREHVYAEFPEGGGHLDVDDRDGFGPEHYYAECAALESGNFRFAVGYFSGDGPVNATLRVKVGNVSRAFAHVLRDPLGRDSLMHPVDFATLEVKDREREVDGNDRLIADYDADLYDAYAGP